MKLANPLMIGFLMLHGAPAMAIEEPGFTVVSKADTYEIRHYEAYLVAEVDVEGQFSRSGDEAFRILANYIFGGNRGARKMAMTAPVESQETDGGVKMDMTVPVTSSAAAARAGNSFTYSFVMERKYTLESLPVPNDPRIQLREVAPRHMAVRRYSGRWTESNYRKNETLLLNSLNRDNVRAAGRPILARYNAPFVPPFLRRNEVMIEVEVLAE